eukprot:SAG31_NODE_17263_length_677_cov_1.311419_1_plen_136_part_00
MFICNLQKKSCLRILSKQEVTPTQLRDLKAVMGANGYAVFHAFRDADGKDEACVSCIRADRFEEVEQGKFWLAVETPDVPSLANGAEFPRVAIWQRLRERHPNGRELLFVVTHLDHPTTEQAELNRKRSAEQVAI